MSLVKLSIKGISYSQTQNGAYALILNEVDGERKLPIVIGAFEAQSIAIALEKEIKPPRPLTHDLFKNFAERFEWTRQPDYAPMANGMFGHISYDAVEYFEDIEIQEKNENTEIPQIIRCRQHKITVQHP